MVGTQKTLYNEICDGVTIADDWLKANRLLVNIDKTNYILMTHTRLRQK